MESGYVRFGLNTRIARALDALENTEWRIEHGQYNQLQYRIEQAGEIYVFSPGRTAEWLGLS